MEMCRLTPGVSQRAETGFSVQCAGSRAKLLNRFSCQQSGAISGDHVWKQASSCRRALKGSHRQNHTYHVVRGRSIMLNRCRFRSLTEQFDQVIWLSVACCQGAVLVLCRCSKRSISADVMPSRCALGVGIIHRCRVQLHGDPEPGRNLKVKSLRYLEKMIVICQPCNAMPSRSLREPAIFASPSIYRGVRHHDFVLGAVGVQ